MGMSRRSVGCFSRCERRATAYLTWREFFVLACIAWGKEHRGQLLSLAPGAHFYPRQSFMKMSAPSRLFAGRNAAILWERTTPDRDFVVHSLTGILEKQNPLNMPRIHHQGGSLFHDSRSEAASPNRRCSQRDLNTLTFRWSEARPR